MHIPLTDFYCICYKCSNILDKKEAVAIGWYITTVDDHIGSKLEHPVNRVAGALYDSRYFIVTVSSGIVFMTEYLRRKGYQGRLPSILGFINGSGSITPVNGYFGEGINTRHFRIRIKNGKPEVLDYALIDTCLWGRRPEVHIDDGALQRLDKHFNRGCLQQGTRIGLGYNIDGYFSTRREVIDSYGHGYAWCGIGIGSMITDIGPTVITESSNLA